MNEEKNLKDEIIKEMVEMTESFTKNTMEEIIFDEYFKIAEDYVNNKPYNLKNNLTMIGFAVETNRICDAIQDENLKNNMEEKCQIIWDKWYQKIHNTIDEFDTVKAIKKKIEEKSKN